METPTRGDVGEAAGNSRPPLPASHRVLAEERRFLQSAPAGAGSVGFFAGSAASTTARPAPARAGKRSLAPRRRPTPPAFDPTEADRLEAELARLNSGSPERGPLLRRLARLQAEHALATRRLDVAAAALGALSKLAQEPQEDRRAGAAVLADHAFAVYVCGGLSRRPDLFDWALDEVARAVGIDLSFSSTYGQILAGVFLATRDERHFDDAVYVMTQTCLRDKGADSSLDLAAFHHACHDMGLLNQRQLHALAPVRAQVLDSRLSEQGASVSDANLDEVIEAYQAAVEYEPRDPALRISLAMRLAERAWGSRSLSDLDTAWILLTEPLPDAAPLPMPPAGGSDEWLRAARLQVAVSRYGISHSGDHREQARSAVTEYMSAVVGDWQKTHLAIQLLELTDLVADEAVHWQIVHALRAAVAGNRLDPDPHLVLAKALLHPSVPLTPEILDEAISVLVILIRELGTTDPQAIALLTMALVRQARVAPALDTLEALRSVQAAVRAMDTSVRQAPRILYEATITSWTQAQQRESSPLDLLAVIEFGHAALTHPDSPPATRVTLSAITARGHLAMGRTDPSDVDAAIDLLRSASTDPGFDDHPLLGMVLAQRYRDRALPDDLVEADRALVTALDKHPDDANVLQSLGFVRRTRFQLDPSTLSLLVDQLRREHRASPDTGTLEELANKTRDLYLASGDEALLHEAMALYRDLLDLTEPSHPHRPTYLRNYAHAHADLHSLTHDPSELDQAIDLLDQSVALTPSADERLASRLHWLAFWLNKRRVLTHNPADLDTAITTYERCIDLTAADDPEFRPRRLNLAWCHRDRFLARGDDQDLVTALTHAERLADDTPETADDRPAVLYLLGSIVFDRYRLSHRSADAQRAWSLFRQAVDGTPAGVYDADRVDAALSAAHAMYDSDASTDVMEQCIVWLRDLPLRGLEAAAEARRVTALARCLRAVARVARDRDFWRDATDSMAQLLSDATLSAATQAWLCATLGATLCEMFLVTDDIEDVNHAIHFLTQGIVLDAEVEVFCRYTRAQAAHAAYHVVPRPDLLESGIDDLGLLLDREDAAEADRTRYLTLRSELLQHRMDVTGDPQDADAAARDALSAAALLTRGRAESSRESTYREQPSADTMRPHPTADLAAIPHSDRDSPTPVIRRVEMLLNAAKNCMKAFHLTNIPAHLHDAVAVLDEALQIAEPDSEQLPKILAQQATQLVLRYHGVSRSPADLHAAFELATRALTLSPESSGSDDEVARAYALAELAVRSVPGAQSTSLVAAARPVEDLAHASPASWQLRVGALLTAAAKSQDLADIDSAIAAVEELPAAHAVQLRNQAALLRGQGYVLRYRVSQDSTDFDRAIAGFQPLTRLKTPFGRDAAVGVGMLQAMRYQVSHEPDAGLAAAQALAHAIALSWSQPGALADQLWTWAIQVSDAIDAGLGERVLQQVSPILDHVFPVATPLNARAWLCQVLEACLLRVYDLSSAYGPGQWAQTIQELQGLTNWVSYDAAAHGEVEHAITLTELGSAVLAAARLDQENAILDSLRLAGETDIVSRYRAAIDELHQRFMRGDESERVQEGIEAVTAARSAVETAWGAPLIPRASWQDLNELTADGTPLAYLIASDDGGALLLVSHNPDSAMPRTSATLLPTLTYDTATTWAKLTEGSGITDEALLTARGTWRAGADAQGPPVALADLPDLMRAAIEPALPSMAHPMAGHPEAKACRLVPAGFLGSLPWSAALNLSDDVVAVSVAGSGKLHQQVRLNRRPIDPGKPGWLAAVTNPHKSTWPTPSGDQELTSLPSATEEGAWLRARYRATHLDGPQATWDAVNRALQDTTLEALHFATHGDASPDDPATTHLILTNPDPSSPIGPARTITASTLPALTHIGHVFLASCWTAHPNPAMPYESQSLPTTFLATGTHTVVAPLWPVDDATTGALVRAYYRNWCDTRQPPPLALANAFHSLRSRTKDLDLDPNQRTARTITINAFNCTGGL